MKKLGIFSIFAVLMISMCSTPKETMPMDGDIVFHESKSIQSRALKIATGSNLTHMGLVILQNGKPFVYEAAQHVHLTPLNIWIKRGVDGEYKAMRLKNSSEVFTSKAKMEMIKAGTLFNGKKYDLLFQWSDDKIYCSELVWKIYKRGAGVELCPLKTFADFNIESKEVQKLIDKRYNGVINLEEKVVAPSDIYESGLLESVVYGDFH